MPVHPSVALYESSIFRKQVQIPFVFSNFHLFVTFPFFFFSLYVRTDCHESCVKIKCSCRCYRLLAPHFPGQCFLNFSAQIDTKVESVFSRKLISSEFSLPFWRSGMCMNTPFPAFLSIFLTRCVLTHSSRSPRRRNLKFDSRQSEEMEGAECYDSF